VKNLQTFPQIKLRISVEMRDWLQDKAQRNFRSMNAEIVHRLDQSRAKENAPEAATSDALAQ
jgi:hypothetical protein